MAEAPLQDTGSGLAPAGEGWFVVNVRDAAWQVSGAFGGDTPFEGGAQHFPEFGIRVATLEPGQPNGLYHAENQQEAFLVLAGECTLLVEGEQRELRAWDFFHCPAGVEHIFVGSGAEPCVILMAGARKDHEELLYPVSPLAAEYGASADEETTDPGKAYSPSDWSKPGRPAYWDRLPWA
jgi:uncharacterized cupin superfamily protein